jgi:hypothetical protein
LWNSRLRLQEPPSTLAILLAAAAVVVAAAAAAVARAPTQTFQAVVLPHSDVAA